MSTSLQPETILTRSSKRGNDHPFLRSGYADRIALIGKTGTGKSTFARHALSWRLETYHKQLVMVDPKWDFTPPPQFWPGGRLQKLLRVVRTPEDLVKELDAGKHILYRPHPERVSMEDYDGVFRALFWRGHLDVYLDELKIIPPQVNAGRYPAYEGALYQQGRSKGIFTMGGTQRPAAVPVCAMSEVETWVVFRLAWWDDRARMRSIIGNVEWPEEHSFWWYHVTRDTPIAAVLRLE